VATRAQVLIPVFVAAVIIGVAGIMIMPTDKMLQSVEFPKGTIKVDDIVLVVDIADTPGTLTRGLMFQDELPYDHGMLFVFDGMQIRSIWMLNMQFPLDIIWFDNNGDIVHIEKNIQPCKTALETATCQSYKGGGKHAQYVLEVTAGFIDKFGVDGNSKLEIISI